MLERIEANFCAIKKSLVKWKLMLVHGLKVKQEEDKKHESNDLVTVILWCYGAITKQRNRREESNLAFVMKCVVIGGKVKAIKI